MEGANDEKASLRKEVEWNISQVIIIQGEVKANCYRAKNKWNVTGEIYHQKREVHLCL